MNKPPFVKLYARANDVKNFTTGGESVIAHVV